MMLAWGVLLGMSLDTLLGEPRRAHPLVAFGRYAQALEARFNPGGRGWRSHGVVAWCLAVLPWVLLTAVLCRIGWLAWILQPLALYASLGLRSLSEHAEPVALALQRNNLPEARRRVGYLVSRETVELDETAVARAATESVLENGSDAVFAALFWFALLGAPGVVLYRLGNTLDAMWGYRTPRLERFGWAAARLDDVLNYLPARLVALTYALLGRFWSALESWRQQAPQWDSPNAGPVMAAGAGALGVSLGGAARYHGEWHERPVLGRGPAPTFHTIRLALRLVRRGAWLWAVLIALGGWLLA